MSRLKVQVPAPLEPLLYPARYKGAHGGRGGAKSHFFAEQLVVRSLSQQTRWACIREVQNSLKESVHQLLSDKIQKFGLGGAFEVQDNVIKTPHDGHIIFRGMQAYTAESIKSLEGYDGAWVEEAQTLSAVSLRMLRPTIRKSGSELWFSWNPRHDTDPVDMFFRGPNRHPSAVCCEVNWRDNPWFPAELEEEKDFDFAADPEMAEHVWNGGYELVSEGAYYAKLIAQAEKEGRVGYFPYNPALPVITSWDIGIEDYTAIWFIQEDGEWTNVIDFYETGGDGFEEIRNVALPELHEDKMEAAFGLIKLERETPFVYGKHHLPHDVKVREIGAGGRHRWQSLKELGIWPIHKGVATSPAERVAASRDLLPRVRFHRTPRVDLGLKRLRRYRRKFNDTLNQYTTPLHDESSHAADAFGEYALNVPGRVKEHDKMTERPKTHDVEYVAREDGTLSVNMTVRELVAARERRKRMEGRA